MTCDSLYSLQSARGPFITCQIILFWQKPHHPPLPPPEASHLILCKSQVVTMAFKSILASLASLSTTQPPSLLCPDALASHCCSPNTWSRAFELAATLPEVRSPRLSMARCLFSLCCLLRCYLLTGLPSKIPSIFLLSLSSSFTLPCWAP